MIISKINFPIYGIIILLSIIIGMFYIYYNLHKKDISKEDIFLYFMMYISFAFSFGKFYTFIMYNNVTFLTAGLSAYGGLIGTIIGALLFEKMKSFNGNVIKYTILSLPLVYSLSKISCSIVGCCGGIPYDGIFKVIYIDNLNIWQFPIQILEVIISMIIFIICNKLNNNKNINYITIALISIFKFILDFLRYDHMNILITRNQYFSIILLIIVILLFIFNKLKNNRKLNY